MIWRQVKYVTSSLENNEKLEKARMPPALKKFVRNAKYLWSHDKSAHHCQGQGATYGE